MKELDVKSELVAAVIGAVLFYLWDVIDGKQDVPTSVLVEGAVIGALVQIGVRLVGVS